jgi:hypothetical protein
MAKEVTAITVTAAARKLGHLGGLKGGKARKVALSPERRSAIARKGAKAKHARESKRGS